MTAKGLDEQTKRHLLSDLKRLRALQKTDSEIDRIMKQNKGLIERILEANMIVRAPLNSALEVPDPETPQGVLPGIITFD